MISRLFVGVVPPADVCAALAMVPRPDVAGVRWTARETWHITLRFLGQADEETARVALAELRAAAVEVVLGPVVELLHARVVVVEAAGLESLALAVGAVMGGIGQPSEERPFRGHLTLGRVRPGSGATLPPTPFESRFWVEEVVLVRSRTLPSGAVHDQIARRPLRYG